MEMSWSCGGCGKNTIRDTPLILIGDVIYHEACLNTLLAERGETDGDQ